MKFARLVDGLLLVACWVACACAQRAPEASALPASAASSNYASPPAVELAPVPAPASSAAAAPAPPQGLDDESSRGESADLGQEFSTLEAAERALSQAQADLDRLALAEPPAATARSAASDGAAAKKGRPVSLAPKAGAAASSVPSALCENACRAFSSLSRAANAVCRIDGKAGAHCAHAQRVLADSQLRVASCSCPSG